MEEKPAQWVKDGPAWKKMENQEVGQDDLGSTTLDGGSDVSSSPQSVESEHRLQRFLPARVEEGGQSGSIERTSQSRERISESMLREYRGLTIRLWEAGDDETAAASMSGDGVRDPGLSHHFEDPTPSNDNSQAGEKQRVKVHIERQSPESKARTASSVVHDDAIEAIDMLQRAIRSSPQPRAARDSASSGDHSNEERTERTMFHADQAGSSSRAPLSMLDQLSVPPMPPSPPSSQSLPLQPPQSQRESALSPATPPRPTSPPLASGGTSVESGAKPSVAQPAAPHNAKNSSGATPLHLVAATGSLPGLKLLIGHGAYLDAQDAHGRSTLHVLLAGAIQDPLLHVVALLDAGANPNLGDNEGCTPLHMAAESGNAACVRALLAAGAESVPTATGDTPLHLAAQGGHLDVMQALVSGDSTDEATKAAAEREESERREALERRKAEEEREATERAEAEKREAEGRRDAAEKMEAAEGIAFEVLSEAQQTAMEEVAREVVQQARRGSDVAATSNTAAAMEGAASTGELKLVQETFAAPELEVAQLKSGALEEAEVVVQSRSSAEEVDSNGPSGNNNSSKIRWKSATSPRSRFRERSLQRAALGSANYLADRVSSTDASDATDDMSEASSTPTTATSLVGAALESQYIVNSSLVNSFAPGHNYMSYSSDDEPFLAMEEQDRWVRYESEHGEYFYNPISGESQWEPPNGSAIIQEASPDEALTEGNEGVYGGEEGVAWTDYDYDETYAEDGNADDTNEETWPEESAWEAFVDEESGATYYYNWTTDETSWEYPWVEEEYPDEGGDYESDAYAGATVYNDESSHEIKDQSGEVWGENDEELAVHAVNEEVNEGTWPEESAWEAFVDEESGATYYYNWTTDETSWEYTWEEEEYPDEGGDYDAEVSAVTANGFGDVDIETSAVTAEGEKNVDDDTRTVVVAEETKDGEVDAAPVSAGNAEGVRGDGYTATPADKENDSVETGAGGQEQASSFSASEESRSLQVWNKFFEAALTRAGDIDKAAEAAAADDALLLNAVMAGDLETVEQLILRGVPAVCVDTQGRTPLHYASYNGNRDVSTRRKKESFFSVCECVASVSYD